ASATTAAASRSVLTITPSAGRGAVRPHARPRSTVIRTSLRGRDGGRRSDDAAKQSGCSLACDCGGRNVGDVGDLPEQVDDLLHVAHEVARGQVLVLEHLVEGLPGCPCVGDREEGRLRWSREIEPGLVLDRIELVRQRG